MSLEDIDRLPRLRDTHTADQLDTEACTRLAAEVLKGAAKDYILVRRELQRRPFDRFVRGHMQELQRFYRSSLFKALSCGLADGETVMKALDKQAGALEQETECEEEGMQA